MIAGFEWLQAAKFRHTRRSFNRFSIITSVRRARSLTRANGIFIFLFFSLPKKRERKREKNNNRNMRRLLSLRHSCVILFLLFFWLRVVRYLLIRFGVYLRALSYVCVWRAHPFFDATARSLVPIFFASSQCTPIFFVCASSLPSRDVQVIRLLLHYIGSFLCALASGQ